ncbi:thiamine diphosphate-binding protein [Haematococcus lacustris]
MTETGMVMARTVIGSGVNPHEHASHGDSSSAPNLGVHLANRLVELGCTTAFAVPGDYNLLLLDQLLKHPALEMVWCCNELNAGYAADGYARAKGIGAVVVTYGVGAFSVFNAIAGAMSEDLPVIVIAGNPNSNDYSANRVLHHTTGSPDFNQQLRAFKEVTCAQVSITHVEEAARLIDFALSTALAQRKPALIEVACNVSDLSHPSFTHPPVPFALTPPHTNEASLAAAVEAAVAVLDASEKPVLLAGPRLRAGGNRHAFMRLAEASQYAYAHLPDAKGLVAEDHPHAMGLYWGATSWPGVCEAVEAASHVVTAGTVWTDYSTTGWSLLLQPSKVIKVGDGRVTICGGTTFGCIDTEAFLDALAKRVKPNNNSVRIFQRMALPRSEPPPQAPGTPLIMTVFGKHLQAMLNPDMVLISEVGDSWFNTQKLLLPRGCGYEMQMRYGSIGWSVGCTLGMAAAVSRPPPLQRPTSQAAEAVEGQGGAHLPDVGALTLGEAGVGATAHAPKKNKRVVTMVGDGSFQMTAQEVSTIMRFGLNPIMFLINNDGYTIEVQIHDGPYNRVQPWNYTGLVEALHNGHGKLWTTKVRTEEDLVAAIAAATSPAHADDLCFIEVFVDRDDCSKELLEWGSRVASANSRKPGPAH